MPRSSARMKTMFGRAGAAAEAPKTKLQAPEKHQTPNTRHNQNAQMPLEVWSLELLWCVDLGFWCFISRFSVSPQNCSPPSAPDPSLAITPASDLCRIVSSKVLELD